MIGRRVEAHLQGLPSRLLQSVSDITGHWAAGISHKHQVARIHHQISVAKHGPPLTDQHIRISCQTPTQFSSDIKQYCWLTSKGTYASISPARCTNKAVWKVLANMDGPPADLTFSAELRMTDDAQNCPFFIWMTLPVLAAATRRSVCRHRKAGIWMMSATLPTASAWLASCMSVIMGIPYRSFTFCSTLQPFFEC